MKEWLIGCVSYREILLEALCRVGIIPLDKKYKDFTETERNLLLYGATHKGEPQISKLVEGIECYFDRQLIKRNSEEVKSNGVKKMISELVGERECPCCHGKRLNDTILGCKVMGYGIDEMCELEFEKLREVLLSIEDKRATTIIESLVASLTRMIDIGLPYLSMNRESADIYRR